MATTKNPEIVKKCREHRRLPWLTLGWKSKDGNNGDIENRNIKLTSTGGYRHSPLDG